MPGTVPIPLLPPDYHVPLNNFSTVYLIKQKTEAEEAPPGEPKVEETPAAAVAEKEAVPAEPVEPAEQAAVSDLSPMPPLGPHPSHLSSCCISAILSIITIHP